MTRSSSTTKMRALVIKQTDERRSEGTGVAEHNTCRRSSRPQVRILPWAPVHCSNTAAWSRDWHRNHEQIVSRPSALRILLFSVAAMRWSPVCLSAGGDPGGALAAGGEPELGEDVLDVVLCGPLRDHQRLRDRAVA